MNEAREHRQWLAEQVRTKPEMVIRLDDPIWVIVIGETYSYRDFLKRLGFRWNPKHRHWRFYEPIKTE